MTTAKCARRKPLSVKTLFTDIVAMKLKRNGRKRAIQAAFATVGKLVPPHHQQLPWYRKLSQQHLKAALPNRFSLTGRPRFIDWI